MKAKPRRRRGTGSCYQKVVNGKTSKIWTIQYFRDGKRVRESSGTTEWATAHMLLRERLVQVDKGEHIRKGRPERFEELYEKLLAFTRLHHPKSEKDISCRWRKRLEPVFGKKLASSLTPDDVTRYTLDRKAQQAYNGTIMRELAVLKSMLKFASEGNRPRIPKNGEKLFPTLPEDASIRKGYVTDEQFDRLVSKISDVWLRTFVEIAYNYGARAGELLSLRVRDIDLESRTLIFHWTKNGDDRPLAMTPMVEELLRVSVVGKQPDDYVFTRDGGKPVKGFSRLWRTVTAAAGLGWWRCKVEKCKQPWKGKACECGSRKRQWSLLVHDLRRSASMNMRAAGVPESVIMNIGGWRTAATFRRYAIINDDAQRAAFALLQQHRDDRKPPITAPATPKTSGGEVREIVQ
jgi:integrase